MTFRFHPAALAELQNAAEYYEQQLPLLGLRFVESVENTIQRITQQPNSYAVLADDVRRCLTKSFPYAVLYTQESNHILIIAVMHCHRRPNYWLQRLT